MPALPTFLLTFSSSYLIPFPLYGSGGRIARIVAAIWPTVSLFMPDIVRLVLFSTLIEMLFGGIIFTG